MLRFVPPAGVPLKMSQILQALRKATFSNGHSEEYASLLAAQLDTRYVLGVCSGRAALWLILRSLSHLKPERNVVALPAYNCFSVPASVVRAGLKIYPIDIDPNTLDFDQSQLEALPNNALLCIITSNLFGFPNDLLQIRHIARAKGAFVVDDAAQALGATRDGRFAGTLGDVGLYSLGRGKTLASIEGGLVVTNSEDIARSLQAEAKHLQTPPVTHGVSLLLEMLIYSVLINPRLYWIPNSMPFLKLGVTEFNPAFPTDKLHSFCQALLPPLLDGLTELNETRRANAVAIIEALAGSSDFAVPRLPSNTKPTFVRLPVVARDNFIRERAVRRLRDGGFGASAYYPSAICDIAALEPHMSVPEFHRKSAELLSKRLLTLPVHPLVRPRDRERMVDILMAA